MGNLDLKKYGIVDVTEIVYNPSYEQLFEEEMNPELEGFEKGQLTELDAVNVMTGIFTGRSPKDKYIVDNAASQDIWWTTPDSPNDNKKVSEDAWSYLKEITAKQLSNKRLFVMDTFLGANENSRLKVRFIMEVAWQAHFVKNMFIRPTANPAAIRRIASMNKSVFMSVLPLVWSSKTCCFPCKCGLAVPAGMPAG